MGRRHHTNQDALCLAVRSTPPQAAVLAISDGVTTAEGSEVASLLAAETVVASLTGQSDADAPIKERMVDAFKAAHEAVMADRDAPSACTLLTAYVDDRVITVGNIGDSRAYWIGDDGAASLLSTDDSMAQARIMLGMSREAAEQSSQAHALTKWLGRQATDVTPSVVTVEPTKPGWLILCSDGLWNYVSSPEAMQAVVQGQLERGGKPNQLAEGLVAWANEQGGRDNITVVAARFMAA